MSDLDYEDEVHETMSTCTVEHTSKSSQDHPNSAECSEISQGSRRNSEEGELESDAGEVSNCDLTDLEEGEINDENTDGSNFVVCRFFQNGNCRYGKQCRFVHIGASAYKMFDSRVSTKSFHLPIPHPYVYHTKNISNSPPLYCERNGDTAWEQGLEEAKKLLLISKDKKEADVEFEDKKLYLQLEKETVETDRKVTIRKRDSRSKRREKKRSKSKTKLKPSPSEKDTKFKKYKNHSKPNKSSPEIWTDPWRRSRSRRRSTSSSSLSSRRWTPKSSCSSLCSLCSSDDNEQHFDSRLRTSEPKSKLQRVFSRTFSRSRSRKRSLARSRSKSCSASLKRSLYRSYSRSRSPSSSASWCSKKSSIQKAYALSISNQRSSNPSKISPEQHKRKLSPEPYSRWEKETASSEWDCSSSDLTVSSITCTSFSGTRSSVDSGSVKRAKDSTDSQTRKPVHSDEMLIQSHDRNCLERDKYPNEKLATAVVKPKSDDTSVPDVPKKTTDRKAYLKKDSPVPDQKLDTSKVPAVKKPKKRNVSELELLKYLPVKSPRPAAEEKKPPAKSTEAEPKKVISMSLKSKTKLVPATSVLSSPVHKPPPTVVSKPLSRREQLLRQLEAVESAIAKKKKFN